MKSPAFQFYPQDFISSLDVQLMTVEEVGAYCLLLFNSWIQEDQGYLPDNEEILKRICRMSNKQWDKSRETILKKFEKKDGKLFNKRLIIEINKQNLFKEKQAVNGSKGGRPKKEVDNEEVKKEEKPNKPKPFSGLTQTKPKKRSSSSFSSSEKKEEVKEERFPYYIGDQGFVMLYDFLKVRFHFLLENLQRLYPDPVYGKALDDFLNKNLQKRWGDEEDFRSHLNNSFKMFNDKNGESIRKQAVNSNHRTVNDLL